MFLGEFLKPGLSALLLRKEAFEAELIARKFCKCTNLTLDSDTLIKTKSTPPQAQLSFKERKDNNIDAFKVVDKSKVKSKVILLVDDVYTTGSTINECAKALIKAGDIVPDKQDN